METAPDAPLEEVADKTDLSPEERDLLARAQGRDWQTVPVATIKTFLDPGVDSTSALYLWKPDLGAAGLRDFERVVRGLNEQGIRVAVATLEGGNAREELIDLRASQVVFPAFRIPRLETYPFIEAGLPVTNSLIVSQPGEELAQAFSPNTPLQAYRGLLETMAPKR